MRNIKELMNLDGRAAVVSGGAGSIGAAICAAICELGGHAFILDFDQGRTDELARRLNDGTKVPRATPVRVDLEDEKAVRAAAKAIERNHDRVSMLVNCAALVGTTPLPGWVTPFQEQSSATWRRGLEVNLTAPFVLCQELAPALAKSGSGSIVNVSSIYGMVGPDLRLYEGTPMGQPAAYAASKGGLLQFTRYLSTVLAPTVRVNAVSPGGVYRGQPSSFQERYVARTPLKRMATEEDVIGAVIYLLSDMSAYVTGQNLAVDGGWTAW